MLPADAAMEFPLNWTVLVPVVMAFAAVWLVLPTPARRPVVWPILAGILAVVGLAFFLDNGLGPGKIDHVEHVLFTIFSSMAVLFAGLMLGQRNPARAALCFALVVLNVCGLFLLLAAPFLMAATIIIYAGAIIVTFLFVLMLSQQRGMSDADDRSREPFLAALVGSVLLGTLLVGLQRVYTEKGIDYPIQMAHKFANAGMLDENLKNPGYVAAFLDSVESVKNRLAIAQPVPAGAEGDKPASKKAERLIPADAVRDTEAAVQNLRNELSGKPDLALVKVYCTEIERNLNYLKAVREGAIDPNRDVHLSPHSQSRLVVADRENKAAQNALPAANVAALGRSLFTDHLLAVELGGTLLLVATIGAIAIAGTRQERAKS